MESYFDNTKSEPSKIEIAIYIGTESEVCHSMLNIILHDDNVDTAIFAIYV